MTLPRNEMSITEDKLISIKDQFLVIRPFRHFAKPFNHREVHDDKNKSYFLCFASVTPSLPLLNKTESPSSIQTECNYLILRPLVNMFPTQSKLLFFLQPFPPFPPPTPRISQPRLQTHQLLLGSNALRL